MAFDCKIVVFGTLEIETALIKCVIIETNGKFRKFFRRTAELQIHSELNC